MCECYVIIILAMYVLIISISLQERSYCFNLIEWNASQLSLQLSGLKDNKSFVEKYNTSNDVSPSPNEFLESQPERAHHTTSPSVSHWQSATSADLQLPPRKKIGCEKENIDEAIE